LEKSQWNKPKAQRKRQTPQSNQDEVHQSRDDEGIETPYTSSENFHQTNLSTDSQVSTQAPPTVDFDESPLEDPLNPLYFPNIPDKPSYSEFARYLGPDSIDDLFRPQLEHSGDVFDPNMDSTEMSLSRNYNTNLDQYVSTLEPYLQNGQGLNDSTDTGSYFPYNMLGNVTFGDGGDGGVRPFIPLSPYVMQMYSAASGDQQAPRAFFTDGYFIVDQNDNLLGSGL
jgi:hypothetical protein